jgi:hypothetical protein
MKKGGLMAPPEVRVSGSELLPEVSACGLIRV